MATKLDLNLLKISHSEGKSNRELAKEFGVNHKTIAYYLSKLNLKCNTANQPIDKVSESEARCKKCSEIKPLNQFQFGRKGQKYEYRFSYCNTCRKKQVYLNLNNSIDSRLSDKFGRLKRRAKKENILFLITIEEFKNQYNNQNGLCFYTDEIMTFEVGNGISKNCLSVDKIIPEKGYVVGNVVFCLNKINTCKNDLNLDEIKKWMPFWYERIDYFINKFEVNLLSSC
jgi:hypothetical protein